MTRMTGPDCVIMCNLINTHTHTHIHTHKSICFNKSHLLAEGTEVALFWRRLQQAVSFHMRHHIHALSLSLSLTHTHTHTHRQTSEEAQDGNGNGGGDP